MKLFDIKVQQFNTTETLCRRVYLKFGILSFAFELSSEQYIYLLETLVQGGEMIVKAEMNCPPVKHANKYILLTEEMFNTKDKYWYEEYETTN